MSEDPRPRPQDTHRLTPMNASDLLDALIESDSDGATDGALPLFPGYQVRSMLGRGGAGCVYLAVREGSEALVAIKHLEQAHAARDAQRAWRELDLLSQLRAPCLPRVLDYGHHLGRIFIVTEFIEGLSLLDHCEKFGLDRRDRVALLADVADAVQTLHDHGILHRDIKPSNVLITAQGQPIIIDLGIAVLLTRDVMQTLTAEGAPLGSPAYMAPEQARGERNAISIRSDVYSLGATAYQVLTGQTPHDMGATIHESVRRVAQDPPREPRSLDSSIHRALAAVLHKAVAPVPERRYATARDFAADLRRWLHREPVHARRPSPWVRALDWMRRHPIYTTAVACLALIAMTLGTTYALQVYFYRQPASMRLSPDASQLQLLTRSGAVIREWNAGVADGVLLHKLIPSHSSPTGEAQIIAGFRIDSQLHPGRLCIFDAREGSPPVWSSLQCEPSVPAPKGVSPFDASRIILQAATTSDIDPSRHGDEIIALYHHVPNSPACLRIHASDGEVMAEIWHMGYLLDVEHNADADQLIVVGVNSHRGGWTARHPRWDPDSPHPLVAFALDPNEIGMGRWIGDFEATDSVRPLWYKALFPPDLIGAFATNVSVHGQDAWSAIYEHLGPIHIMVSAFDRRARVRWRVSSDGEFERTEPDDSYESIRRSNPTRLPVQSLLEWRTIQPLLPPNGETSPAD
jgi:serine/threonine protein kinase